MASLESAHVLATNLDLPRTVAEALPEETRFIARPQRAHCRSDGSWNHRLSQHQARRATDGRQTDPWFDKMHGSVAQRRREETEMPLSIQIVVVGSQLVMTAADRPLGFDMAATCRLHITAVYGVATGPQYDDCMRDEQSALRQLQGQWLKFPNTARTDCAP
jgi:hypothetical protein